MHLGLPSPAALACLLVGCAPAPRAPAAAIGAAPAAAATTPPPRPTEAPTPATRGGRVGPPPAFEQALDAAQRAIASGDATAADERLAAASGWVGGDAHLAYLVARVRATRYVYAGDFDRAAAALVDVLPALAAHPELADEFWSHNALMMIREAQGDPASALAEDDEATLCAARGSWGDAARRATLAFQKDRWHRAYLTRMLAERRTGSAREALLRYARQALDEYRPRGFPESVAVLEAYFAALDGRAQAALEAARRVDPTRDDDVEDLYLVVVGLEAGGDRAGAEAVRRIMRAGAGEPRISRGIMLRWLEIDAEAPRPGGFTPWHAARR